MSTEKNILDNARDKARDVQDRASASTKEAVSQVGRKLEQAGGLLGTGGVKTEEAAAALAEKLENAGQYLQETDLEEMAGDVVELVKRYPVQSLLAGLGIGFFVGRMFKR